MKDGGKRPYGGRNQRANMGPAVLLTQDPDGVNKYSPGGHDEKAARRSLENSAYRATEAPIGH